jgi:TRAP transporter TAXI family solute receptor
MSVPDLRGRSVSVGAPGSGTEVIADRVLTAAGLDPRNDIRRQGLSVAASVDALRDGKIDAFVWSGGLPTGAILDLAHSPGAQMRLIASGDVLPRLRERYGDLYFAATIPPGTYAGVGEPVSVVGVANVLVAHERLREPLAYDITRVLFEHQAELAAIHPEAATLALATATVRSPAPFHPGAIRYYEERNAWKP